MNISQKPFTPSSSNKKGKLRIALFFAVLIAFAALLFFISLLFGSAKIDPAAAVRALFLQNFENADFRILFFVRLPRVLAAAAAGAALALAGAIIQAVLNNPMAAPNVIGVNAGAGFCAVLVISVFPAAVAYLPLAAFLGALAAAGTVYAIAAKTRGSKITITLVGIAIGSMLSACTGALKMLFPDTVYDADSFMIGGLSGVDFSKLLPALAVIIPCLLLALLFCRGLDVLTLGSESAQSLGMNVFRARFLYLTLASALAGAAVSFAGLLGFVGLLSPHIARRFVGSSHRFLLPACALGGASLVLGCDLISRVIFAPYELPVGVLLSLIGGPFFIFLVLIGGKERYD